MKSFLKILLLLIYLSPLGAQEKESKSLNIAVVFDIFFPAANGILTGKVDFAKYLMKQGHKVIFIAPQRKESTLYMIEGLIPVHYVSGIEFQAYPGLCYCLPRNKQLKTVLTEEKIDVVHLTAPAFVNLVTLNEATSLDIPVIHTFHTNLYEPKYMMKLVPFEPLVPTATLILENTWFKYFMDYSTVTTTPSREMAFFLQSRFPDKDIRPIRNGIDLNKFKIHDDLSTLQTHYPHFDPQSSILFVGRISKEKELEVLFEAMTLLTDKKIHLYLVGDGPEASLYKTQVSNLGLEDRVTFLGQISNKELVKSGLMHYSRLIVNPSTTETFGMTILEAICCKIPVVIPDVSVNREIVKDSGILFAPGKAKELSYAIERLCHDSAFHARCVKGAELMQTEFDSVRAFQEMEHLYLEVSSHE